MICAFNPRPGHSAWSKYLAILLTKPCEARHFIRRSGGRPRLRARTWSCQACHMSKKLYRFPWAEKLLAPTNSAARPRRRLGVSASLRPELRVVPCPPTGLFGGVDLWFLGRKPSLFLPNSKNSFWDLLGTCREPLGETQNRSSSLSTHETVIEFDVSSKAFPCLTHPKQSKA